VLSLGAIGTLVVPGRADAQRLDAQPCTPSAAIAAPRLPGTLAAPTSVGVLHFVGRSRNGDDAHLAAALTAEVAEHLRGARLETPGPARGSLDAPALVVRLSDAGTFTRFDLALTGSVFREGTTVRSDVRLTRTSDGAVVWRGSLARSITDLPVLAHAIAQHVATWTGARVAPAPLRSVSPPSPAVQELLLRGRYVRSRFDPDSLVRAVEYFDAALALNSFSRPARRLRDAAELRLLAWGGRGQKRELNLMSAGMLRRVLERDRDESELLIEQADAQLRRAEPASACRLLNAAVEADPRAAPAYALRALLRARGRTVRDAFGDAETVTQLGRPLWGNSLRAIALMRSGDATAARALALRTYNDARTHRGTIPFWDARFIAQALLETGKRVEAIAVLQHIDARDPRLAWLRTDPAFRDVTSALRSASPGR
jgi:TolB-like protein